MFSLCGGFKASFGLHNKLCWLQTVRSIGREKIPLCTKINVSREQTRVKTSVRRFHLLFRQTQIRRQFLFRHIARPLLIHFYNNTSLNRDVIISDKLVKPSCNIFPFFLICRSQMSLCTVYGEAGAHLAAQNTSRWWTRVHTMLTKE